MGTLRSTLRPAIYGALSNELLLGYSRRKWLSGKTLILMYHELADDSDDIESWTVVRKTDFLRQMEYLKAHFEVIGIEEAISRKGRQSASDRPLAAVTFDDGYAGNKKTLLPIAEAMELPVAVFVATRATLNQDLYWYDRIISAMQSGSEHRLELAALGLGSYVINRRAGAANWVEINRLLSDMKKMEPAARLAAVEDILARLGRKSTSGYRLSHLTVQEIKAMAGSRYITIGAHSHCHSMLPQLPREALIESIRTSKRLLEEWTGRQTKYFAYPSGAYDSKVLEVVRECEFECAFTTRSKPWETEPIFEIPRLGIGRYDSFSHFKVRVSNALGRLGK